MLKVVVDTRVILRGAASARASVTGKIYDAWDSGRFTLALSDSILVEIEDVLSRPGVIGRLRMRAVEAVALVELLRRRAVFVTPAVPVVTFWTSARCTAYRSSTRPRSGRRWSCEHGRLDARSGTRRHSGPCLDEP